MASRLPLLRRISKLLRPLPSSPVRSSRALLLLGSSRPSHSPWSFASSRRFCSDPLNLPHDSQGAAAIDYRSVLQEDEFHRIANSTIHDLQEKLEEYGDIVQIDGFDVDYGNEVLTLKLGALGTYVLNKQTPNRQIWLSSPGTNTRESRSPYLKKKRNVLPSSALPLPLNLHSGPSRFDWDFNAQAWVYRRTKANLLKLLESELEKLCGEPVNIS
ncbi:Frataxin/CyaY - like 1 [Theobroma cacao]|nr:Frataxin/CyaY - like 1 [Theobroma cacao]